MYCYVFLAVAFFLTLELTREPAFPLKLHSTMDVPTSVLEENLYTAAYKPSFRKQYWCQFENPESKLIYNFIAGGAVELLIRRGILADTFSDEVIREKYEADKKAFAEVVLLYTGEHELCV